MKILKFWYVFCILFCFYSLNNQAKQRYKVDNRAVNQSEGELIIFACKEFSFFNLSETHYELSQLKTDLYNHFNTSDKYSSSRSSSNYQTFKKLILDQIEIGNYMIFNGRLCFIPKNRDERFTIVRYLSQPPFFAF